MPGVSPLLVGIYPALWFVVDGLLGGIGIGRLTSVSEWQPIETAPKDGTYILLAGGEPDPIFSDGWDAPMVSARWDTLDSGYNPSDTGWRFCSFDSGIYGSYSNPTHWRPLPDLPQAA